jgi:hypothetical protein
MKKRKKFPFPRRKKMTPDTLTLTVTPQLLNTIMGALAALPFKDAAGPINEIQRQIQAQVGPPPTMRSVPFEPSLPEAAAPVGKSA